MRTTLILDLKKSETLGDTTDVGLEYVSFCLFLKHLLFFCRP